MKTIKVNLYEFKELGEEAKQRVKTDHFAAVGFHFEDEAIKSLKKLAEHFHGRMSDWSIDFWACSHSSAEFDMPEVMSVPEIRKKLHELGGYNRRTLRGHGDCKLTGVCYDEDAIDGLRWAFLRSKETDLGELMQAAFKTWLKTVQDEAEYQQGDEAFQENCEANEYWFYESGRLSGKNPKKNPV